MPFSEVYRKQAALVVRALPEVAREDCFALKGGTGINLFIRDMPRLSVDIDLTYLPVQGREQSLAAIDAAMRRIEQGIKKSIRGSRTTLGLLHGMLPASDTRVSVPWKFRSCYSESLRLFQKENGLWRREGCGEVFTGSTRSLPPKFLA